MKLQAPPKTKTINLKGCSLSHLDLFRLPPPSPPPAPLPHSKPVSPSFLYTAGACRHFIAATGDMVRDVGVDNVFWGEGMAGEMKQRWRGGEKLLEFEGHHFRSINVKHCALLSDIIKRLSPLPGCQSHCLSPSFLFAEMGKKTLFLLWPCAFV